MTITALDTHEIVKDLTAAGFTENQAEAVTRWVRKSQDIDLSNLVTKADLASTTAELQAGLASVRTDLHAGLASVRTDLQAGLAAAKTDLAGVKAELQISLAETKAELLRWMVGATGIQTVVILGAVVALAKVMAH